MKLMRTLLPLLLAFLLAFAQQAAALHALSHLTHSGSVPAQQDHHLPNAKVCDKCLAFAETGSAIHSATSVAPLAVAFFDATLWFAPWISRAILSAAPARAPPLL